MCAVRSADFEHEFVELPNENNLQNMSPSMPLTPLPAVRIQCCTDVLTAIKERHQNCLEGMTREDLLFKDNHGQSALHYAVRGEHHEAVKYLCSAVPELREWASQIGETPLLIAAGMGSMTSVENILQGTLRDTINMAMHRDVNGTSVLMAAVARGDNDMALWLLKRFGKALAMLPNKARMLPLHVAAAQGNIEFIRIATKYDNQMVNFRDEFGCTPCVYAVQGGCLSSVRYLVEKARSEMGSVSNRGQSLLHICCLSGHEHITRWILNRMGTDAALWTTNDLANAVHCAAFSGSVPCLSVLLGCWSRKKRSHVLALRDSRGNSPLHLTAINNHLDAALFLLENNADTQLVNNSGHAPQAIALMRGHSQMARMLANHTDLGKKGSKKKEKGAKKSRSHNDLQQHGAYSTMPSGVASPIDYGTSGYNSALDGGSRMASPRQMSSGYSSSGGSEMGNETVIRRPLKFVEDASEEGVKKDCAAQTDDDLLVDHIKVLDDHAWTGAGLAAVEQIDRVLEEVEELQ